MLHEYVGIVFGILLSDVAGCRRDTLYLVLLYRLRGSGACYVVPFCPAIRIDFAVCTDLFFFCVFQECHRPG